MKVDSLTFNDVFFSFHYVKNKYEINNNDKKKYYKDSLRMTHILAKILKELPREKI